MGIKVNAFTNDALGNMDAVAVGEAIANKKISVKEAVEAAIQRAESANPALNAIVLKTYDQALDTSNLESSKSGLFGVPTFIKDNDDLAGFPTQYGTQSFESKNSKNSSKFVKQLTSTGVRVLGKSTLTEFGIPCSAENEKINITRNPWNPEYTSGGSSSGSASLVASGVVPIATANDGAGSIRIPAAVCGLVGLKSTRHRLRGLKGVNFLPIETVQQGVVTRTVRDTALFLYEAEKHYRSKKLPPLGHIKNAAKERLKIVFFKNPALGEAGHQDENTHRLQNETAELLKNLGHTVEQISFPIDIQYMTDLFLNYYGFQAFLATRSQKINPFLKTNLSLLEPITNGLSNRFKENIWGLPGVIKQIKKLGAQFESLFSKYDIVMMPTLAHKTPKIGYLSPNLDYETILSRTTKFASYCGVQNITGSPAVSLPLGFDDDNMPLGVQFCAPHGFDKRLLELSYELEEAQPWKFIYNK